jgi:SAM-dependent methyltransferase
VPGSRARDGWRSYDAIADAYARVLAVRNEQLARDLVAAVAPPFAARVLDVGTGTGVAAEAAAAAVGTDGIVVGIDPAPRMLDHARRTRRVVVAVAEAPGLPFMGEGFDAIVASLVVADVRDYADALADIAGALKPGGRLGVSTWGSLGEAPPVDRGPEQAARAAWTALAEERVPADALAAAREPWRAWFEDPAHLRAALSDAGLRQVELTGRAYRYAVPIADWLSGQHTTSESRFVRETLGDDDWARFERDADAALRARVADPIECVDESLLAVGTKPGAPQRPVPTMRR